MDAFSLALYCLGRRACTEQEIRDKLQQKKMPSDEIEAAILRLKRLRYIDDIAYANNFQRSRDSYKPTGLRRLQMELRQKGVGREIVESLSADKEKELALAIEAGRTRLRQYSSLEKTVYSRRMTAFLARRGFSYDIIVRALALLRAF